MSYIVPLPPPTFEEIEQFRLRQIQRLNEMLQEADHQNNILRLENDNLKQSIYKAQNELADYKDTMRNFYNLYQEQIRTIEQLKGRNIDQQRNVDLVGEQSLEMRNDVKNLILDRDLLINKLEVGDRQYSVDVQGLTNQLNEKNKEIADLRKRVNDLLELKRRNEEEIQGLKFQMEHQRQKYENELREKQVKLNQLSQQGKDNEYLKDRELIEATEKIRTLEHEIRRLLDLNRNYASELSMLARDNRMKQEEIDRLIAKKQDQEYPVHQAITQQTLEPRPPSNWQKKLHEKIDQVLNFYDKAHQKQLSQMALTIWKMKFNIRKKEHQNQAVVGQNQQLQHSRNGVGKDDFKVASYITEGLIALITFTREAINSVIFEVFVRSVNHATKKRTNSFIIFILNVKELRQRFWKGLQIVLEVYSKMRKCLRGGLPLVIEARMHNSLHQKIELAIGKLLLHEKTFRDNVNKWLEGTLVFTIQKKQSEHLEKNQDFLFLFRLLTVKYRITFPLKGNTFKVDTDIETFLEHKICYALRKILKTEPE